MHKAKIYNDYLSTNMMNMICIHRKNAYYNYGFIYSNIIQISKLTSVTTWILYS